MKRSLVFPGFAVLLAAAWFVVPPWLGFLMTSAFAKSLVVLGVVLLMRTGLVSFGQALFYGGGAYASAYLVHTLAITDAAVHAGIGLVVGAALAALVGVLVARYREIFFAMLTLAFSMVFWALVVQARDLTGGTQGLPIGRPTTMFGLPLGDNSAVALYLLALALTVAAYYVSFRFAHAPLGFLDRAIRDNEIRVSYLGGSVRGAIFTTFVWAGAISGVGGSLAALNVAHIDPTVAVWTTSGEFVFVALISGTGSVFAPLIGTIFFEVLRSYITSWYPELWQLTLGTVMLLIVLFLPGGLWSLGSRLVRRRAV
ncbi:MAG: branched-chain amino acid ABC transporter permease, partial [Dehalococcoidia bacterium]